MCRVTNEALHQVLAMVKAAPEDQGVIQKLEQYIADFGNSNLKYELISAYRKYSPNINTSLIFKILKFHERSNGGRLVDRNIVEKN